jgi:uncharacterized membrane protein YczE
VSLLRLFRPVTGPRLRRRFSQLIAGLLLFGAGIGLMLRSDLGVPPWDVLHQGLAVRFGLTVGIWSILVSVAVLLAWVPIGERFGVGTVLNALIIGVAIDLTNLVIPDPESPLWAWGMLLSGILVIGLASGLYIGADLGPGPRDGLMTGIARRGPSIRLTRSVIEVVVLGVGWVLGGRFGVGTILFALLIGPLVQFFLSRWDLAPARALPEPTG